MNDVLLLVLSAREDEPAIATAQLIATAHDATVSTLLFSKPRAPADAAYAGLWAIPDPVDPSRDQAAEAARLARRLGRFPRVAPIKPVERLDGAAADHPGLEARCAGMTIMLRPAGASEETFRRSMFESALYDSGRPVLVTPRGWRGETVGRSIMVAWDGSREAARAAFDAACLFDKAERVTFLTVDAGALKGPPAQTIVNGLRRAGVQCHCRTVSEPRQSIDFLLLRESSAMGADLIVMGGYGHPRVQELIFGGVTRSMLRSSPIPLFMSR